MGRRKHDWEALKTEYIISDCKTLSEFAEVKGLSYDTLRRHSGGWIEDKAQHGHKVSAEIKEADKESRVLSLRQQREYLSGVVAGMLNQWRRLNTRLSQAETDLAGTEKVTPGMRNQLRGDLNALTRLIPELVKTMELLSGRATERNISESEEAKTRGEDLKDDFGEIKERFKKLSVLVGNEDANEEEEIERDEKEEAIDEEAQEDETQAQEEVG